MDRRIFTITSIFLLLILGSIGIKLLQNHVATEDRKNGPSHQEILNVVTRDKPAFLHNGIPFIEISSVKRLEDVWYVVTIKSPHDKELAVPVKIVLRDQGSKVRDLKVILGPDTHFTDYELLQYPLPDSLMKELKR